jgi:hypothetical protein
LIAFKNWMSPVPTTLKPLIDIGCDIVPGCRAAPDGLWLTEVYRG